MVEVEVFKELWKLGVNALIFIGALTVIYAIIYTIYCKE